MTIRSRVTGFSSITAPVLLMGGFTIAAHLQGSDFSSVRDTISDLAAEDAVHREVMTAALIGTGIAYLVTSCMFVSASRWSRFVLALGGVGTILVAANPLPADDGPAPEHALAAGLAFIALSAWPALSARRGERTELAFRPPVAIGASIVLFVLLAWFGIELLQDGAQLGLSERVAAGSQAMWPLVAVFLTSRGGHRHLPGRGQDLAVDDVGLL